MVVLAFVLLLAVLAFSLMLLSRLSRQVHAGAPYASRGMRFRARRRPARG